MGTPTGSWTVRCQDCGHAWKLVGHWSHYEREAIESRPCPSCGAYALASPEPRPNAQPRRAFHAPVGSLAVR
jgi:rRNA maturation endonuclease Nob1